MTEKIISLILTVIVGFFAAQLSVSRVEMKVNRRFLNQYFIYNHENLFETIIPIPPPPIPEFQEQGIIILFYSRNMDTANKRSRFLNDY